MIKTEENKKEEYEYFINEFYPYEGPDYTLLPNQDKEAGKRYLQQYWLSTNEYNSLWKPIQENIYINRGKYVDFADTFELIAMRSGNLFLEKDFNSLMDCFREVGDKYFVVIENCVGVPPIRLKFPTDISWKEIMSGNYISYEILRMVRREYFVYTESGKCGKYAANDSIYLDLIAFEKKYENIFKAKFKVSREEREEIYKNWLPENYKSKIINNSL